VPERIPCVTLGVPVVACMIQFTRKKMCGIGLCIHKHTHTHLHMRAD
jgi:hypothetical protein